MILFFLILDGKCDKIDRLTVDNYVYLQREQEMRMGDMGPRGAINMGGRDWKQRLL